MNRDSERLHILGRALARVLRLSCLTLLLAGAGPPEAAVAQPAETREAELSRVKMEKAKNLEPYTPTRAEELIDRAEDLFLGGQLHWHPFFESAYAGGGFTLGAGYRRYVNAYDTIDVRGSLTIAGYKRVEAEYLAPRLFDRRGVLSILGGWREATQVGFYGLGTGPTSQDGRANYSFQQPYGSARLEIWPTRKLFVLGAGVEVSKWEQGSGSGAVPSVEERYTPITAPGLGASPTYFHTQGSVGLDWRTSPGYSRRGGAYFVTLHDFADTDDAYGFRQVDYDVIQHLPLLRDAWVLSLHGRVETTYGRDDQQIPFFMLPALGGGSTLRGYASWRFRDRHSLLLQAEWRVLANRFLDMAVFCDAGKVTARRADLDLDRLKSDCGLGFRMHGPAATPLRIELAKGNEGLALVFSAKAAF